jgi:hypothetical protein
MDETPEELEQIRREAAAIDVHQYRKRFRALAAIALGAAMAGLVWLVMYMVDSKRNPCERVRDHFCKQDRASPACSTYDSIMHESVEDKNAEMRRSIRAQFQTKIQRLKDEDGITVR